VQGPVTFRRRAALDRLLRCLNAGYGFNQTDNVTTLGGPILVGPGANGVAFANALGASSNAIVPLSQIL